MRKLLLALFITFFFANSGFCALIPNKVNIVNLKENGMYLLDLNTKVKNISIGDKAIMDVSAINSLTDDMQQLFIQTNKTGVCDVLINTEKEDYKIRFVLGQIFEDIADYIIPIDMPKKGAVK